MRPPFMYICRTFSFYATRQVSINSNSSSRNHTRYFGLGSKKGLNNKKFIIKNELILQ